MVHFCANNSINFHKNTEERPVLEGVFATSWWWNDKKTLLIINKNNPTHEYYNQISFYTDWQNPIRIKEKTCGIFHDLEENKFCYGFIERVNHDTFYCQNYYEHRSLKKIKLTEYARFICTYNLEDLPLTFG